MFRAFILIAAILSILIGVSSASSAGTPSRRTLQSTSGVSFLPSEEITYRSFSNQTYTLNAYSGKYVRYALPNSWLGTGGLSPKDVQLLVDLTDILYAQMKELVGGEPGGSGLLTIAVVDIGTNGGLAFIGRKGVEISPTTLENTKLYLFKRLVPETIIHEMSHCFDIYHDYLGYYPDWGHAWTSLLVPYLEVYSRSGSLTLDPEELLEKTTQDYTSPWYALGGGATWVSCVRNGGGCEASGVKANEAWAGLILQYVRLHGAATLKQAMLYLRDYKAAHADFPPTPEAKNDLLMTALATGAGVQLSCEIDGWRWYLTDTARTSLGQSFPAPNPYCADADGDSYSPLRGDFDDHNQNVHPGAAETTNGIDDDCNRIVDDVLFNENGDFGNDAQTTQAVSVPSLMRGHASPGDRDVFRIEAINPLQLDVEGRSINAFRGTVTLAPVDGFGNPVGFSISTGQTVSSVLTLERPGTWLLTVTPDASVEGDYEVKISKAEPLINPVRLKVTAGQTPGSLHIQATVDTTRQFNDIPTYIRFWIGGEGFIRTLPVAQSVAFDWTPMSNGALTVRAQLIAGDVPVSRATEPVWFDTATGQPFNPLVADLQLISRVPVPPTITNNQPLVYGVEVKNLGPDVGDNAQAIVTLGQGLRVTSTSTTRGTTSQSSASTTTVTIGPVAAGETLGVSVSVDLTQVVGTATTSVIVSTTSNDTNSSNNGANWSTSITTPPATSPFFGLPLKPDNSALLHVLPENGTARALVVLPGTNLGNSYAQLGANGLWPTNLDGVTVNVAGRPAQVIAVTQAPGFSVSNPIYRVDFALPQDGPTGSGITITVTHAPSGSSWSAPAIIRMIPCFWSTEGSATGAAIAQNADTFVAFTPARPAPAGSQTRVVLYATGLRSLVISNSLIIRARLSDGRTFVLPVDYAEIGKILHGLDQLIVRLTPELAGGGLVVLSIDGFADSQVSLPVQ
jgi:Domain of unknown function DUF11/Putative metal-binding motif